MQDTIWKCVEVKSSFRDSEYHRLDIKKNDLDKRFSWCVLQKVEDNKVIEKSEINKVHVLDVQFSQALVEATKIETRKRHTYTYTQK